MRGTPPWAKWREKGRKLLGRYKFVLLVVALGVVLLAWPGGEKEPPAVQTSASEEGEDLSVAALERKLAETLSKIRGAGDVTVMLTVQSGAQRVLAEDESLSRDGDGGSQSAYRMVILSKGSAAGEEPILIQQLPPRLRGALVVCEGADSAALRLKLMEAVSALTGLGADKISICEGKG